MDSQVLVAYATKYGAMAEIAEKIGQVLREAGLQTDVLPVDRVSDLRDWTAIHTWASQVCDSLRQVGGDELGG